MHVRPAAEDDLTRLAELGARLQRRPEHHVAYLGLDDRVIAAELVEEADWWEAGSVAVLDGRVVGWLIGSVDTGMGRVWWFGPFVDDDLGATAADWSAVADRLDAVARRGLAAGVTEEEWAFDARHVRGIGWAQAGRGIVETGSAVLGLDQPIAAPLVPVRPLCDDDVTAVAELHDALFPGSHITGVALVSERHAGRVVLVVDGSTGRPAGYVAVELQADATGYIDYVGVDPAARRRGLGAELVRAGVAALRDLGCVRIDLTVRSDNAAARSVYARLGFAEERVIVPVRRGFTLG